MLFFHFFFWCTLAGRLNSSDYLDSQKWASNSFLFFLISNWSFFWAVSIGPFSCRMKWVYQISDKIGELFLCVRELLLQSSPTIQAQFPLKIQRWKWKTEGHWTHVRWERTSVADAKIILFDNVVTISPHSFHSQQWNYLCFCVCALNAATNRWQLSFSHSINSMRIQLPSFACSHYMNHSYRHDVSCGCSSGINVSRCAMSKLKRRENKYRMTTIIIVIDWICWAVGREWIWHIPLTCVCGDDGPDSFVL